MNCRRHQPEVDAHTLVFKGVSIAALFFKLIIKGGEKRGERIRFCNIMISYRPDIDLDFVIPCFRFRFFNNMIPLAGRLTSSMRFISHTLETQNPLMYSTGTP
jgi:hypothetical protein